MNEKLVKQLRTTDLLVPWTGTDGIMWLAADEIERLAKKIKELEDEIKVLHTSIGTLMEFAAPVWPSPVEKK